MSNESRFRGRQSKNDKEILEKLYPRTPKKERRRQREEKKKRERERRYGIDSDEW